MTNSCKIILMILIIEKSEGIQTEVKNNKYLSPKNNTIKKMSLNIIKMIHKQDFQTAVFLRSADCRRKNLRPD